MDKVNGERDQTQGERVLALGAVRDLGFYGNRSPFDKKALQSIGCYLKHSFGNIRFRILKELGSTKEVACVVELVYPYNFAGIRIGIPRGVVSERRSLSPLAKGKGVA